MLSNPVFDADSNGATFGARSTPCGMSDHIITSAFLGGDTMNGDALITPQFR